jgi:hypothetical protein
LVVALVIAGFFVGRATAPNATPAPGRVHPARLSAHTFSPDSITFASPRDGWALGTVRCHTTPTRCLALLQTRNAGRTWRFRRLPSSLLHVLAHSTSYANALASQRLEVRFANTSDGWIFGPLRTIWSTFDGGTRWHEQQLAWIDPYGQVLDVEGASGFGYLIAPNRSDGVTVEVSTLGTDNWTADHGLGLGTPAGGGQLGGTIVLRGAHGWIVVGNDRGTSGSVRLSSPGHWVHWTPPCFAVGHSFAVPSASTPNDLVAVCSTGGYAYPLSRAAPPGATLGSSWLYVSHDAGTSFAAGPELRPIRNFMFVSALAAPSPRVLLAGLQYFPGGTLLRSVDGGARWGTVFHGAVVALAFSASSEGTGLVERGSTLSMIMTFDAGAHWITVRF